MASSSTTMSGALRMQPGQRHPLLLAAREPVAPLADDGVEAVGQLADQMPDLRLGQGVEDLGSLASGRAYMRLARSVSWKRWGSWVTTPTASRTDAMVACRTSMPLRRTDPAVTS